MYYTCGVFILAVAKFLYTPRHYKSRGVPPKHKGPHLVNTHNAKRGL